MSGIYKYHPRWTAKRHDWLRHLANHPGSKRSGKGHNGYACMRFGWTEWVRDLDGRLDAASGEVLTDEGRRVLADWDADKGRHD